MTEETLSVLLFVLLLMLSAFFSGSETALVGSRRLTLESMSEKGSRSARRVLKLLDDPASLLGTVLVGNNMVNVAAAVVAVNFLSPGQATLFVTLMLLLVGEIPPKTIAAQRPEAVARVVVYPITAFKVLFSPVVYLTGLVTDLLMAPFSRHMGPRRRFLSQDEIRMALDHSEDAGVLEPGQAQMAQEILDISTVQIGEIMIPLSEAACLQRDWPLERVLEQVRRRRFTRYPVYSSGSQDPAGILHVKDLVFGSRNGNWQSLIRRLPFRNEKMGADDLLRDMQISRYHMAAVVNDDNRVVGYITMERILEEIVGEIADEHDQERDPVCVIDEGVYRVRGDLELADIERILNVDLDIDEDEQTVEAFYRSRSQNEPTSDILLGPIRMKPGKYGYLIQILEGDAADRENGNGSPDE